LIVTQVPGIPALSFFLPRSFISSCTEKRMLRISGLKRNKIMAGWSKRSFIFVFFTKYN
jgi:hypothetical protein